jgi:hypothetical protein
MGHPLRLVCVIIGLLLAFGVSACGSDDEEPSRSGIETHVGGDPTPISGSANPPDGVDAASGGGLPEPPADAPELPEPGAEPPPEAQLGPPEQLAPPEPTDPSLSADEDNVATVP